MTIGTTLLSAGVSLLNGNKQAKAAKATQEANTAQFQAVKDMSQPFVDAGTAADVNGTNYQTSPGFESALKIGTGSVLGSKALNGLLNSGSAVKALTNYATGAANQDYNSYISNQNAIANRGVSAIGDVAGGATGIANANNTAAADQNAITNQNTNTLNSTIGALGSNASVNSLFNSFLSKIKGTGTGTGSTSSYGSASSTLGD